MCIHVVTSLLHSHTFYTTRGWCPKKNFSIKNYLIFEKIENWVPKRDNFEVQLRRLEVLTVGWFVCVGSCLSFLGINELDFIKHGYWIIVQLHHRRNLWSSNCWWGGWCQGTLNTEPSFHLHCCALTQVHPIPLSSPCHYTVCILIPSTRCHLTVTSFSPHCRFIIPRCTITFCFHCSYFPFVKTCIESNLELRSFGGRSYKMDVASTLMLHPRSLGSGVC